MNYKKLLQISVFTALSLVTVTSFSSCKTASVPNHIKVVTPFDIKKFDGTWYEIARFDFKHEKDLSNVTANYTLKENGGVQVLNKGYNYVKNKWEEAKGKAKFTTSNKDGSLQVSFFGPFYAGYHVVMMEPDYETALIFGDTTDNIWILSRTKTISEATKQKYLTHAKKAGYDLNRMVWTKHDK